VKDGKYSLAIVGATGMVGREVLKILEEHPEMEFDMRFLASERSKGEEITFKGKEYKALEIADENLNDLDFAVFAAGGRVSKTHIPKVSKRGTVCIDNSSVYRMQEDVPLIIPEVNPHSLSVYSKRNIITNPNCTTSQLVPVIYPIHKKLRIKRIVMSTYQSVSGAGQKAIDELSEQVIDLFNSREVKIKRFPHQIAFNCLPHIDVFDEEGNTEEELKVIRESRKIIGDPELAISVTAVRVPVFSCHCESVNIETEEKIDASIARDILSNSPGISLVDDASKLEYPLPLDVQGLDDIFVGRIRDDRSRSNCLNMWIVADNLRKGAALNNVQILESLIRDHYRKK
jgi:aspartate-semialdehyde dehydrogenase